METSRTAELTRNTNETQIEVSLKLDGEGKNEIATGIPFLDHMLQLFSKHGFFDLKIKSKYAEVVSKIVCCSTFLRDKLAFSVSSSDFLNVFNPLKPEKIFCSTEIFLLSESELESAKLEPL